MQRGQQPHPAPCRLLSPARTTGSTPARTAGNTRPHLPLRQVALAVRGAAASRVQQLCRRHGHAGAAVVELGPPVARQYRQPRAVPPHPGRGLARRLALPRLGRRLGRRGGGGGGSGGADAAGARRRRAAAAARLAAAGRRLLVVAGCLAALPLLFLFLVCPVSRHILLSLPLLLGLGLVHGAGAGGARRAQRARPPRAAVQESAVHGGACHLVVQRVRAIIQAGLRQLARQKVASLVKPGCGGGRAGRRAGS